MADPVIRTIFIEALDRPLAERAAFLDQACGSDANLRQRVDLLLQAHDQAGEFFADPKKGAGSATRPPLNEAPGDRIGRYKLLEQIGEGGCGVVYMAEQEEPVRRRVALKVIKLGMDTKQVIARFEAERQALAMMDHPNIAKVFDAGTTDAPLTPNPHPASGHPLPSDGRGAGGDGSASGSPRPSDGRGDRGDGSASGSPRPSDGRGDRGEGLSAGRPYFVMELIRGVKITEFCDENQLSTEERLKLFVQVCQAIQHAHQKGVIHRDIKPSNVLVALNDGVAVPKVIDFGIAKATAGRLTDQTLFTAFEQFLGTPAYMSPEQAVMTTLDIDTRSDIYSLGVLLYELLTGRPPFEQKELLAVGLDEMRRTIREVEPPKPSTRITQELVAADVRRRTDLSEKESTSSRRRLQEVQGDLDWIAMKCLEKDRSRRYETASGLAADIERHLKCEPVVARPPSKLYEFQKSFQRHKFGFAATTAIILALAVGLAVSMRMYWAAQAEKKKAQAQTERAETEAARSDQVAKFMKGMLKGAGPSVARGRDAALLREILQKTAVRIEKELANRPEIQGDLWFTLGETYGDIGDEPKSIEMYVQAVKCYRQCFPQGHTKLALSLCYLGAAQSFTNNLREGTNNAAQGLRMARQLNDEWELAWCLFKYGCSLHPWGGGCPAAAPYFQEALAISRKVGSNKTFINVLLMKVSDSLTNAAESLPLKWEVLTNSMMLEGGSDNPNVAYAHFGLGQVLAGEKQWGEAASELGAALKLWRKHFAPEHPHRGILFCFLIEALAKQEKWAEIEDEIQIEGKSRPEDAAAMRAAVEIRRENWERAVQMAASIFPALTNKPSVYTAPVLALQSDTAAYHEHTRQILQKTALGTNYVAMEKAARATLLLLPGSDELQRAGELADAASQVRDNPDFAPWGSMTKALAEYRRGNFGGAVEWSARSISATNVQLSCSTAAQFIQALAYGHLGESNQAQKVFAAGNQAMQEFRVGENIDEGIIFNCSLMRTSWGLRDWLAVEVLRRQAAAFLHPTDPKQGVP